MYGIKWDEENEVLELELKHSIHAYPIEFDRISEPMHLLCWVHHLLEKDWFDNMDARVFMEFVCKKRNWNLFCV